MLQHFVDAAKALDLDIDLIMFGSSTAKKRMKSKDK
jgi:hypothetical protein